MKNIYKSLALAMVMAIGTYTTASAKIDLKVDVDGTNVNINGSSDHVSQYIMMQSWNGDKKYQIDANKTDNNGNFIFNFKTKKDLDYNGRINIDGEYKDFKFSTKRKSVSISGGGGGGSASSTSSTTSNKLDNLKTDGKDNAEILKKLNNKLENDASINESEFNIQKINDIKVITIDKDTICSKIKKAEDIINNIKSKYKNINFNKDENVIPIITDKVEDKNVKFKLSEDVINQLSDKRFKLKFMFKDSEFKLDTSKIPNIQSHEILEVRKDYVNNCYLEKFKTIASNRKIITSPCNIGLYKINDINKKEDKLSIHGMQIGIKVDSKQLKNISKKSLKISFYDSKENKVKLLRSNYILENDVVVADIK